FGSPEGFMATTAASAPILMDRTALPPARRFELGRRLTRNRGALGGLVMLIAIVLFAVLAPILAPFDPIRIDPVHQLYSPGLPYILGSDQYGRDVFSRVVFGARISLTVGPIAVAIALLPGVTLGLLAGYYGRWVDGVL